MFIAQERCEIEFVSKQTPCDRSKAISRIDARPRCLDDPIVTSKRIIASSVPALLDQWEQRIVRYAPVPGYHPTRHSDVTIPCYRVISTTSSFQ
jgi:hypothetical protein